MGKVEFSSPRRGVCDHPPSRHYLVWLRGKAISFWGKAINFRGKAISSGG
jgi:hypothetical protein